MIENYSEKGTRLASAPIGGFEQDVTASPRIDPWLELHQQSVEPKEQAIDKYEVF